MIELLLKINNTLYERCFERNNINKQKKTKKHKNTKIQKNKFIINVSSFILSFCYFGNFCKGVSFQFSLYSSYLSVFSTSILNLIAISNSQVKK